MMTPMRGHSIYKQKMIAFRVRVLRNIILRNIGQKIRNNKVS